MLLLLIYFLIILLCFIFIINFCSRFCQIRSVNSIEDPKERIRIKINFAKTIAQISGGFLLLLGLFFTWQNINITNDKLITDLYIRAIDQIGNNKPIEVRIGGIYALERIARNSEKDHWPIMEVLTAYVRQNAPYKKEHVHQKKEESSVIKSIAKPNTDIQAILTVLGRRERSQGRERNNQRLDLGNTDLRGADLRGAHFEGVDIEGANLSGALLWNAFLNGAFLKDAILDEARLEWADLRGAFNLTEAQISKAHINEAKLPDYLEKSRSEKK